MSKKCYKIVEEQDFDSMGKPSSKKYYVKVLKHFLFFRYWKHITKTEYSWGDKYVSDIKFSTEADAQAFISEVLCPEIPREKTITKDIEIITCNKK